MNIDIPSKKQVIIGRINKLKAERDDLVAKNRRITRDLAEHKGALEKAGVELAYNNLCPDASISSYKECEKHVKFFISCNQCWIDHLLSRAREGAK